jgi:hypothetical protein
METRQAGTSAHGESAHAEHIGYAELLEDPWLSFHSFQHLLEVSHEAVKAAEMILEKNVRVTAATDHEISPAELPELGPRMELADRALNLKRESVQIRDVHFD